MKIFKLIKLLIIPAFVLSIIPFVLLIKHEVVKYDCVFPLNDNIKDIKDIKDKMSKLENKVDILEKKIDKAQLCKIKLDVEELKKITYGLIGVVAGSSALISGTNLLKKKKNGV